MKILIVKLSPIELNDSANIRTLALAKGFTEMNCTVDYLTIPMSNSQHEDNKLNNYKFRNIIRTKGNSKYEAITKRKGNFKRMIVELIRKGYHSLSLYDYTYSIANNINISLLKDNEYDLIISSSDPKSSHLAVKKLISQGLKYKKWVQYWGDPMAADITRKSIYPKWLVALVEKKILFSADNVIYVSPFTLYEQQTLFPNITDKMNFLPIPYTNEKVYGETKNIKYTVGYFGAYYSNVRNIIPLYNAGKDLANEINLNIVGDSDISLDSSDNINVYPRGDIDEFEKNADLLVCVLNNKGTQIPGKLYHTAATDKPILVIIDGDNIKQMKEYLEGFDRFILCENKEIEIKNAIKEVIQNKKQYKPAPHFNPKTIAKEFLDIAFNE